MIARRFVTVAMILVTVSLSGACRSTGPRRTMRASQQQVVRRVHCVYDQKPWLNLDSAGDRDPEGIRFRVFLDPGNGVGILVDGMLHVEMYRVGRQANRELKRTLVSDWHYHTSKVPVIAKPGLLGDGYFLYLRWATKDIAGSEIELITRFEDEQGNTVRSSTKRWRVPKYRN